MSEALLHQEWLQSLHPKRQKEFSALSDEEQRLILARGERTRRTALRALDHHRRGIDSREHWMMGLDQLDQFLKNPNHSDPAAIAHKKALKVGVELKTMRKTMGVSRADLAEAVGACEKTIKNMELGKPVSSHTLLMAQKILGQPKKKQWVGVNR